VCGCDHGALPTGELLQFIRQAVNGGSTMQVDVAQAV
jgi:hypothetical protein